MSKRSNSATFQLVFSFGVILAMLAGIAFFAIQQMGEVHHRLNTVNNVNSVKQRYTINFRGSVHDRAIELRDVVLFDTPEGIQHAVETIAKLEKAYADSAVKLDAMYANPTKADEQELEILGRIKATEQRTLPLIVEGVALRQSDPAAAKELLLSKARPEFITWLAQINEFIDLQEAKNQAVGKEVSGIVSGFKKVMVTLAGGALLLGMVITVWIVVSVVRRSEGIYAASIAFEATIRGVVDGLSVSSKNLTEISDNLAVGVSSTVDLSEKVTVSSKEASSNVLTIATAAEQISSSINEITSSAQDTSVFAKNCTTSASETQTQLVELQTSVESIASVLENIKDVADQTNLLALNASIEAARAGEAGRGFAVVAEEVKSLSVVVQKLTDDIASKVAHIQKNVGSTVTGIEGIVHQIHDIDVRSNSITGSMMEQSKANNDITNLIQDAAKLSEDVLDNILKVKESTDKASVSTGVLKNTADSLREQAGDMHSAIESFMRCLHSGGRKKTA